ncbi:hypothetical protein JCM8115_005371 [Rhodotorula mucilaginosa]|uniref:Phosphatidate cytidylyltransferase, mitochondrial n=1 Tax=Rhodotorula mucilaginosa TaxID=5537 RepID=A0A9P7B5L1_RHOMI|nr:Mitochondrial translocator assembly and maintenance protein 41 [Rhodotorula mucilaginosa]TKA50422.1 hypothetical protein B0A53_06304 [Rhodotorula sp. CCFEE 5036]
MLRLASPAYHASPAMWLNTATRGSRRALLAPNALSAGRSRPQQTALIAWSAHAPFHSTRLARLDAERQSPTPSAEQGPPPPSPSPGLRASGARRRDGSSSPRPTTTAPPQPTTTTTTPFEPRTPSEPVQNPLAPPPADARVPRRRITSVNELPKSFGRNQMIKVPEQIQRDLEDVMSSFKAPIRYAFAYGSGVFQQKGYTNEDKPLLDFVFAVSHPSHWHAINMQQHPDHYSLPMRLLGSNAVAWMQEKGLGAEVWFNVDVEINGKSLKYGVISVDALCRDLLDWETLYISGRTQKPVKILHDDARVRLANQVNLASALRAALLLLPEEFTEIELFEEIAGLSYRGDFRMRVGENPHKVRNIVAAQLPAFRSLYGGLIKSFWKSVHTIGEDFTPTEAYPFVEEMGGIRLMRQNLAPAVRGHTASRLPIGLREKVLGHYERKWNLEGALLRQRDQKAHDAEREEGGAQRIDLESSKMWERIVADPEFRQVMDKSLAQIVARPTFNQSLKGILSAGPIKSLRYVGPKLRKKWLAASTSSSSASAPTKPKAIAAAAAASSSSEGEKQQ